LYNQISTESSFETTISIPLNKPSSNMNGMDINIESDPNSTPRFSKSPINRAIKAL